MKPIKDKIWFTSYEWEQKKVSIEVDNLVRFGIWSKVGRQVRDEVRNVITGETYENMWN